MVRRSQAGTVPAVESANAPLCHRHCRGSRAPQLDGSARRARTHRDLLCQLGDHCGELFEGLPQVEAGVEIDAEVDWNIELGTIMRLAQGAGDGPATLFNNIKDYNKSDSRCKRANMSPAKSYTIR